MNIAQMTSPETLRHMVLDLRQMQTFIEDPLVIEKSDRLW